MLKSEKHSHQDYTTKDLSKTKPEEWSGQTIVGTQFGRERPPGAAGKGKLKLFPDGAHSIVFEGCCLDNAELPPGTSLVNCTTRQYQVQADGQDWIVDAEGKALRPLDEAAFDRNGWSKDPKDIAGPREIISFLSPGEVR